MEIPDITRDRRLDAVVQAALAEDVGQGDLTTLALVPARARVRAVILARGRFVVSGVVVAMAVLRCLDRRMKLKVRVRDGKRVARGGTILEIEGNARAVLTAERTALNFMQRMTGIATLTDQFVRRIRPNRVAVLDTRKTSPGLRFLEKYAVRCGGGTNHRSGLYDMVLIKDNHRRLWTERGRRGLGAAVLAARKRFPGVPVEIEVESAKELDDALRGAPDWILLDNMPPERVRRCVERCAGRCRLEASGGISLSNVKAIAATGVDAISLGRLTHSAPAADLSLELCR